jgi:hypothetical protein
MSLAEIWITKQTNMNSVQIKLKPSIQFIQIKINKQHQELLRILSSVVNSLQDSKHTGLYRYNLIAQIRTNYFDKKYLKYCRADAINIGHFPFDFLKGSAYPLGQRGSIPLDPIYWLL